MRTPLLVTLWLSACAPASSPEPPPTKASAQPPVQAPSPPEEPIYSGEAPCPPNVPAVVQYRVDTLADWTGPIRKVPQHPFLSLADLIGPSPGHYDACRMAMRCGAERFELLLAPGVYEGYIQLGDLGLDPTIVPKKRPSSIVVRGIGPEPPTLLGAKGSIGIAADHVTIQNLQFQGGEGGPGRPLIWARAEQTLTLSNVHVSDIHFGMDKSYPIQLKAPVINLEDSSFIGNKVGNATCWGSTGHGVCKPRDISTALMELSGDEVNLRRVVFAGNDVDRLLSTGGRLTLDEVAAVGLEDQTLTDDGVEALTLRNSTLAFGGPKWLARFPYTWRKRARPKLENNLIVNPATLAPGALEALNRTAAEKPPTAAELAAAIRALPKKSQK